MGTRESHEPGTFCWVDLMTTDAAGAKSFYADLFGWKYEDTEMPQGGPYTTLQLNGDAIGGLYERRIAVLNDPQGAFLGLFEGEVDD